MTPSKVFSSMFYCLRFLFSPMRYIKKMQEVQDTDFDLMDDFEQRQALLDWLSENVNQFEIDFNERKIKR